MYKANLVNPRTSGPVQRMLKTGQRVMLNPQTKGFIVRQGNRFVELTNEGMNFRVINEWSGVNWINGNPQFGKTAWCDVTQEIISRGNAGSFFAYNPYTQAGREVVLTTSEPYTPRYFRTFTIMNETAGSNIIPYAYYIDYAIWDTDPADSAIAGKVNLLTGVVESAASFTFGDPFNETDPAYYSVTNDGTNWYVAGSAIAPKTISKVKLDTGLNVLLNNKNSYNTLSLTAGWHYNPKDGQIYMVDVQGGQWVVSVNPDDLEDYNYLDMEPWPEVFYGLNVIGRQSWIVPNNQTGTQQCVWLGQSDTGEKSYQPQTFKAVPPLQVIASVFELNNYTTIFANPPGLTFGVDENWILISKGKKDTFFLYTWGSPFRLLEISF